MDLWIQKDLTDLSPLSPERSPCKNYVFGLEITNHRKSAIFGLKQKTLFVQNLVFEASKLLKMFRNITTKTIGNFWTKNYVNWTR